MKSLRTSEHTFQTAGMIIIIKGNNGSLACADKFISISFLHGIGNALSKNWHFTNFQLMESNSLY